MLRTMLYTNHTAVRRDATQGPPVDSGRSPGRTGHHAPVVAGWLVFAVVVAIIATNVPMYDAWLDTQWATTFIREAFRLQRWPIDDGVMAPTRGPGQLLVYWRVWLHPLILPLYWIPDAFGRRVTLALAYGYTAGATYFLARTLAMAPLRSLIVAQSLSLLSFHPFFTWTHWLGNPIGSYLYPPLEMYAYLPATGILLVSCILKLSQGTSVAGGIACAAAFLLLAFQAILADPIYSPALLAPSLLMCGVITIITPGFQQKLAGACTLAIFAVVFCCSGLYTFYYCLGTNAARFAFPNELASEPQRCDVYAPLCFQHGISLPTMILVFLGSAHLLIGARGAVSRFAAAVGLCQLLISIVGFVYLFSGVRWAAPSPAYFELGMHIPYIVVLILAASDLGTRYRQWTFSSFRLPVRCRPTCQAALPFITAMAPSAVAVLWFLSCANGDSRNDHDQSLAIIRTSASASTPLAVLKRQISLPPDGHFKGSVANATCVPGGGILGSDESPFSYYRSASTPFDKWTLEELQLGHIQSFDRGLRPVLLWDAGIPTLENYCTTIPPEIHYVFSRCLARPWDYFQRNHTFVSLPRPALLQCLGVRFLLTDTPLPPEVANTVTTQRNRFGHLLYLQEFPDPNTGCYSPTEIIVRTEASDTVRELLRPDFSFRREVVLGAPLTLDATTLAPVSTAAMFLRDGGVAIQAETMPQTASLLLLPIPFSNSLTFVSNPAARGSREDDDVAPCSILRANLIQAAILFKGGVDGMIHYRFGPFGPFSGMKQDIEDARRLSLREDGTIAYPPGFQPYSVFSDKGNTP